MVDIGEKDITARRARAGGSVLMSEATLKLIIENNLKKGDVLAVAQVAGIMAAKRTSEIIPLCHPLNLSHIKVEIEPRPGEGRVDITADVRLEGRTGVEMEALTAVSAAALTVYDMVKAVEKDLVITDILLMEKSGGRSGTWKRP
ncbi:MAG: cyclic pyranopterin monophosphate synthase MoaC [Deltaproteobacteria bacterium]|nr:cyclic pyranopterin monophosphate synthase MoaC [Deltaproteobacteria bacterium]MBW2052069.1 cyclic pyranopterin monophosphate synthase MoaC [Deltaproteobacteria bacterium]MBW2141558.1 cyclic pyranopterin monophosphate synthase MoaC [Deltaproteobacteria bacterium]MBW2324256.1 cyclic pyranopterin monophosphate synthase MoaC [Deltaproteobacteria bacterium]